MVQPCRVGSHGHSSIFLSDSRLRGALGFGVGSVLETRRMVSAMGTESSISGYFIHGTVSREPPVTPSATTRPLLWLVLRQICVSASGCHGVGTWASVPFHTQKEGLETILLIVHIIHNSKYCTVHLVSDRKNSVSNVHMF